MPNERWFQSYQQALGDTFFRSTSIVNCGYDTAKDNLENALMLLKQLATDFDTSHTANISVNIMAYYDNSDVKLLEYIRNHWEANKHFFDALTPETTIPSISGILFPLAAYNNTFKYYADGLNRTTDPIILPITDDTSATHQQVIGAPEAYKNKRPRYYPYLVNAVDNWLDNEQKSYFKPQQIEELKLYYRDDKTSRSLFSIPIEINSIDNKGDAILETYVLNIYSDEVKMLKDNPAVYFEFMTPILELIKFSLAEIKQHTP